MRQLWTLVLFAALAAGMSSPAQAQFLEGLLDRAERAVKGEVGAKVDRETRRLTRCAMGDATCIRTAERRDEEVEIVPPGDALPRPNRSSPANERGPSFPQGAMSFADEIVSYTVGSGDAPSRAYRRADNALGGPNSNEAANCSSADTCSLVALGSGGELVLRFTDNILTGSGDSSPDLWVFGSFGRISIDISIDGQEWVPVGEVRGGSSGIDLDVLGFGRFTAFTYVRIINDSGTAQGDSFQRNATIDAVGAASTRRKNR